MENTPQEILDSLQFYLGGHQTLVEVFGNDLIDTKWIPDQVRQDSYQGNPRFVLSLKTINDNITEFTNLVTLSIYGCGLQQLPTLPESLKKLCCISNQLTSLPTLPESLTRVDCDHNQLTSLPPLPKSLNVLYCDNNRNKLFNKPPRPKNAINHGKSCEFR